MQVNERNERALERALFWAGRGETNTTVLILVFSSISPLFQNRLGFFRFFRRLPPDDA